MYESGRQAVSRSKNKKLKSRIVTWENGKFCHPKSIPIQRGPLATFVMIFVIMIMLLWELATAQNKQFVIYVYACGMVASVILESFFRLILMCEEVKHITARYDDVWMVLVKDVCHFSAQVTFFVVVCVLYIIYHASTEGLFVEPKYTMLIRMATAVYFLCKILRLNDCPLNNSLWLSENNGLNYGSGMAYSFFHGYLKLVLPQTGTEEKNLEELMRVYEDTNGIKFTVYKLFILIPQSLKVFVSLANNWSPSVEESKSLPEKQKTVAGVQNRSYKNAVYKIVDKDRKIYVSAEYATPLKTFKDVVDTVGRHSAYFNKFKKEITLQFFLTLTEVLKANGLNEFCELVYYEDSYQNDNETCYYDVGQILLTKINKIKNREKLD